MASAEISRAAVEVTLRLSEEEAQFIYFVMHHVGGDPERSPRRHQKAISGALLPFVEPTREFAARLRELRQGAPSLYFNNDDTEVTAHKYRCP